MGNVFKFKMMVMAVAVAVVLGMSSNAHALLIDGFGDDQAEIKSTGGAVSSTLSGITDTELIGLGGGVERKITVDQNGIGLNVRAEVALDQFHYSQAAGTWGTALVEWENFDSTDFEQDASIGINIDITFLDSGSADVWFTLKDSTGETIEQMMTVDAVGSQSFNYDDFSDNLDFDIDDVFYVSMFIDGEDARGMDISIDMVATTVPEPGTVALLGIGLAGLVGAGARRRAKKKAA